MTDNRKSFTITMSPDVKSKIEADNQEFGLKFRNSRVNIYERIIKYFLEEENREYLEEFKKKQDENTRNLLTDKYMTNGIERVTIKIKSEITEKLPNIGDNRFIELIVLMLECYISKPKYKREQIVFYEEISWFQEIINERTELIEKKDKIEEKIFKKYNKRIVSDLDNSKLSEFIGALFVHIYTEIKENIIKIIEKGYAKDKLVNPQKDSNDYKRAIINKINSADNIETIKEIVKVFDDKLMSSINKIIKEWEESRDIWEKSFKHKTYPALVMNQIIKKESYNSSENLIEFLKKSSITQEMLEITEKLIENHKKMVEFEYFDIEIDKKNGYRIVKGKKYRVVPEAMFFNHERENNYILVSGEYKEKKPASKYEKIKGYDISETYKPLRISRIINTKKIEVRERMNIETCAFDKITIEVLNNNNYDDEFINKIGEKEIDGKGKYTIYELKGFPEYINKKSIRKIANPPNSGKIIPIYFPELNIIDNDYYKNWFIVGNLKSEGDEFVSFGRRVKVRFIKKPENPEKEGVEALYNRYIRGRLKEVSELEKLNGDVIRTFETDNYKAELIFDNLIEFVEILEPLDLREAIIRKCCETLVNYAKTDNNGVPLKVTDLYLQYLK